MYAGCVLTCGKDHLLQIVDLQNYRVRQTMRAPGFAVGNTWCSATIGSDERHVAAGSTDGTVFIWEVHFLPHRHALHHLWQLDIAKPLFPLALGLSI